MSNGGRSAGEEAAGKKTPTPTPTPTMQLKLPEVMLRLSVVPVAVASLWEMATTTDEEQRSYGNKHDSLMIFIVYCFKALACVDAAAAAFSLASILAVSSFKPLRTFDNTWLLFLLDAMATMALYCAGCGAAQILYVARNGLTEAPEEEKVCSDNGSFCDRAGVSLWLHGAALLCFVVISFVSGRRFIVPRQPRAPPRRCGC